MCKLDIEKAYDHVNWEYLFSILKQMGFGVRWLKWMSFCIKTVRFFVLVNGESVGFFPSERGLRQGDPLSPFLFIIAMEGLNGMVRTTMQKKWLKGFQLGNIQGVNVEICHLLYADDTVIFCDPEAGQVSFIRMILLIFEVISGLRVNWRKSSIFPIKEVAQIEGLARILGCRIDQFPTIYLGMPLGYKHKELAIWDGIIEKTEKKLPKWKSQYLSLGGRLILINAVLDSLPTYVMSMFPSPARVVDKLDKLRRDFLWNGNKEDIGFHLVKWEVVQLEKKVGGLGIRNLKLHNSCLLMKWLWSCADEDQALWKEVIMGKYGQSSQWCTDEVVSTYSVLVWRTIRNLWSSFSKYVIHKVGDGSKTMFWKEPWNGQEPLMATFSDLFSICSNPEATVADSWTPDRKSVV